MVQMYFKNGFTEIPIVAVTSGVVVSVEAIIQMEINICVSVYGL